MNKILPLITFVGAVFAPLSAQADPFTGFYKVALVEDEVVFINGDRVFAKTEGEFGRGRVFTNSAGKLRFSGWLEDWDEDDNNLGNYIRERTSLFGAVNPTTGRIRLTKIGGIPITDPTFTNDNFVITLKIIKRNGVVVGLTGNGSSSETDTFEQATQIEEDTLFASGYKTRDLPE
ncbi:MAG: hypothetical protein ACPIA7_09735 [Akkermansiaceae bacterium]